MPCSLFSVSYAFYQLFALCPWHKVSYSFIFFLNDSSVKWEKRSVVLWKVFKESTGDFYFKGSFSGIYKDRNPLTKDIQKVRFFFLLQCDRDFLIFFSVHTYFQSLVCVPVPLIWHIMHGTKCSSAGEAVEWRCSTTYPNHANMCYCTVNLEI